MRKPLRSKGAQAVQTAISQTHPAPIRGLNHRDALSEMKEGYALILDNWFPKTSYLEIRGGASNHLTGMTGAPKTLAVYNKLDGTSKMYAVTDAGVFDATSAGAVGANLLARTNGKHQWINYGDGTNNYLIMCNGVDKPVYYDGTTWLAVDGATSPALTGLTTTKIVSVMESKGRLFFIEINSLSFWYLAAGAAGGALTEFPLDGVAHKGGYLVAAANWSIDGGNGLDDLAVFMTSEGEAIVYKGTNPSSASAWLLVGVFEIGKPLGRRCFNKFGGDLLVITENGVIPLSQALQSTSVENKAAITNIIEQEITKDARLYGSIFGWEVVPYAAQSALILNVPNAEGGVHEQYVMNTITKAWCRFTDWNAETFVEFNSELYYATSTKVVKAWTGVSDFGNNINAYGKTSFSYFGERAKQKNFTLHRPILNMNGSANFLTGIDIDYKDQPITSNATYSITTGAIWDASYWDVAYWASGMQIMRRWASPNDSVGYCAACKLKISTKTLTVQWMSTDIVYQIGGIM